jgi:hypothetical protein
VGQKDEKMFGTLGVGGVVRETAWVPRQLALHALRDWS